MNAILTFAKDYFIFMLILFLFSYLVPKEHYRKYIQFFVGVLMVAILMRPVIAFFAEDGSAQARERLEEIRKELDGVEYREEGEDIFEWFREHSKEGGEASKGS